MGSVWLLLRLNHIPQHMTHWGALHMVYHLLTSLHNIKHLCKHAAQGPAKRKSMRLYVITTVEDVRAFYT